jgi:hypothetical protein
MTAACNHHISGDRRPQRTGVCACQRFQALLAKLVRVPKKALKAKLERDKRKKVASKA